MIGQPMGLFYRVMDFSQFLFQEGEELDLLPQVFGLYWALDEFYLWLGVHCLDLLSIKLFNLLRD